MRLRLRGNVGKPTENGFSGSIAFDLRRAFGSDYSCFTEWNLEQRVAPHGITP